ncbi:hypothetical protein [uncultured Bacteroides sp.]|uniref:hypothetical protein n=1 Tax=uncultured Bacteroides sp. TaxID=162156 RepID=UPI00374915C6
MAMIPCKNMFSDMNGLFNKKYCLQYDILFIILGNARDHVKPNNLIAMGKNKKVMNAKKEELQAKRIFQIVVIVLIILCLVLLLSSSFFA